MGTVRITENNASPSTRFTVEGDLHSQSVDGNYSIIRCYIAAYNTGNSSSQSLDTGFQAGTIVGVKEFARKTATPFLPGGYASGATRWRLGPYDVRVDHNADGTRAPIRFGMVLNYTPVSETVFSSDMPIPTIPRRSVSTIPALTVDVGTATTITTNRASSSFTHTLQLWEYGVGATAPIQTIATGVGASYAWTPATSLASYFPDDLERQFFIRTITYNGATQIGMHDLVFKLRAPASMVPTISTVTATDQNPTVASVVGAFVQGLSIARFTVNAAGVEGSTITARDVTFQGATVAAGTDVQVTASGSPSVVATVTDSRGRTATKSQTLPVLPYSAPTVTAYQARRSNSAGVVSDDGAYLRVDLTAAIASLVNGTQRNALTIRAFTRPRGTGPWTARNVITPGGLTYNSSFVVTGGGIFATTSSYDVRVQVEDKFGTYVADTVVATIATTLDLNGTSVGIGKIWEQGALDVAGQIFQNGKAVVDVAHTAAETTRGIVELATLAEAQAGTDTERAVTPAGLAGLLLRVASADAASGDQPGITTTETEITGTSVTFTGGGTFTFDGAISTYSGVMADVIAIRLRDGTTILREYNRPVNSAVAGATHTHTITGNVVLAAGSHRLNIAILRSGGTGTVTVLKDAKRPAYLTVNKII